MNNRFYIPSYTQRITGINPNVEVSNMVLFMATISVVNKLVAQNGN